ncbi:MAG: ribulose-phosphate 3-epimerase [Kiritimatiellae bacterium]|nr:ribulose-phosphate 3-epimerase [Kiritimatiellia bacterium]
MKNVQILPSLLAADFGCLAAEILRAQSSLADQLHIDVMDAHFVPNLSFGPDIVKLARRVSPSFKRNVHLMMTRPDLYIENFINSGASSIQIHVESQCDVHQTLSQIRRLGAKNAIVINPPTPVEALKPYLDEVDEVLVMTVNPGYGGQKFIAECLSKVTYLRDLRPDLDIMVDGGCTDETIPLAYAAGANEFVAGSYLFAQNDMKAAVQSLRDKLKCN